MKNPAKHKILVVDDDVEFRIAVEKILKKEGYIVESASNGEEASLILDKKRFDLVITDLSMPKKDGMALIEDISHKAAGSSVVIIITAFGDWGTYAEAMGKGICGAYLDKPVKKEELLEVVERCLTKADKAA